MNLLESSRLLGPAGLLIALITNLAAEPVVSSNDQQMRFFENRIRPLLVAKCYECHAADNVEGGLRLGPYCRGCCLSL